MESGLRVCAACKFFCETCPEVWSVRGERESERAQEEEGKEWLITGKCTGTYASGYCMERKKKNRCRVPIRKFVIIRLIYL